VMDGLSPMNDASRLSMANSRNRELETANAALTKQLAEAQALIVKFSPLFKGIGYVGSDREFAEDLKSIRTIAFSGNGNALQAAIDKAVAEEREAIADTFKKEADNYAHEYGQDDMGSLSFGGGSLGNAREEYYNWLVEHEEAIRERGRL